MEYRVLVNVYSFVQWCKQNPSKERMMNFLRRLSSFGVCRTLLNVFYQSVVASAVAYCMRWYVEGVISRKAELGNTDFNQLFKIAQANSGVGLL